ncbi:sulfotransferase domain-containing protein [Carboxylicivirga marina]|uniref:Sulfotransferase domain-containing protein n=1 Tax=Carboxylicivirga marina TaxID=2800988 RepID=A0ABS1HJ38_9BACT|nr:sulfotransferase domain-containing protein [Carboxylicivirga marina]MBK3517682.1 sulfotransferase domain-containing protein [Carboxylicivirga marina]
MIKQIYRAVIPEKLRTYIYLKRSGRYFWERQIIKVYSHPRSGTHFLEAFLAKNFFQNKDLNTEIVNWGHWANRLQREEGNEYGKLFGNHSFPGDWIMGIKHPMIYIYRDGRDVAYSIWKTPNFINPDYKDVTFSDFLRLKLDWQGTPGKKCEPKETIAQHWERHITEWMEVKHSKLLIIRYEDLKSKPLDVYSKILKKYYPVKYIAHCIGLYKPKVNVINQPVGLKPNKAKAKGWKDVLMEDDNNWYISQIQNKSLLND